MAAAYQAAHGSTARDYLTFRSVNAKRKSAVEILQETKSLFVKSEAVLDTEQRLVKTPKCDGANHIASDAANRKDPTLAKVRRKVQPTHTRSCSDQLQTNLRRLLNSSSKENVADIQQHGDEDQNVGDEWLDGRMDAISFYELNHMSPGETDIQYQSLPDLSASSRESLSCTIQRAISGSKQSDIMSRSHEMNMSTDSNTSIDESIGSSEKSYGKPPSLPKSLQSMGGSFGKIEERSYARMKTTTFDYIVEEIRSEFPQQTTNFQRPISVEERLMVTIRLTSWVEPKHVKIVRSRSSGADDCELATKLPHQPSLPSDLNEFFQHLGLTCLQYNELTAADSRSCSPMFFSSRGSVDSTDLSSSYTTQKSQRSTSPPAPSPVSVVQTNARVVKWLCKTSQWL